MRLRTRYLGLELDNPLVLGASPLVERLDAVRRAEDHGAAAIVMRSLFEEQVSLDRTARDELLGVNEHAHAEALHYLPSVREFVYGPDEYLEQLRKIKESVRIPVIASLNGVTPGGWVRYASAIDQAGADALELNLYAIGNDPSESSEALEARLLDVVRAVRERTRLPLAVKLSPFFSSLANFAQRVEFAGADGLVLFNRFYQPDFDLNGLDVTPRLELSTRSELRLRLRWLAALSPQLRGSLALSGGVQHVEDVVKGLLAGAHTIQLVSQVLRAGVAVFNTLRQELARWMELNGYDSIEQLRGALNLARCPDPSAFERANYMHVLNAWHPRPLDEARGVW
jgi:dihydroorotate dehydrogenase (fumarate)